MFQTLSHIARVITSKVEPYIDKCGSWISSIFIWYDGLWVTTKPLVAMEYETYCLHRLRSAIKDSTDVGFSTASSALVGLRDHRWKCYPGDLQAAGDISTSHRTLRNAIDRINTLRHSISLTYTELHPWRGDIEVSVLDWLCPNGEGWSNTGTINDLKLYASKIAEVCSIMHRVQARGAISDVQKNNWWVINKEVAIAINTMLQLYTKL